MDTTKKKNLRRTPPEAVKELIELVNLLPFEIDLPSLSSKTTDIGVWPNDRRRYSKFSTPWERWTESAGQELIQIIEDLPSRIRAGSAVARKRLPAYKGIREDRIAGKLTKGFKDYLWGGTPRMSPPNSSLMYLAGPSPNMRHEFNRVRIALERFDQFLLLKQQFQWMIHFVQRHPCWPKQFPVRPVHGSSRQFEAAARDAGIDADGPSDYWMSAQLPFTGSIRYKIGSDGRLLPQLDQFSAVTLSTDIDVRRIRSCQWCESIFWARRVDAFCCSTTCTTNRNVELIPKEQKREMWKAQKRKYREIKHARGG